MNEALIFHFAQSKDEPGIRHLLKNSGLPDEDIGLHIRNFLVVQQGDEIVGSVGVEIYNDLVFLRSLAVAESQRGHGLGKNLTEEILRFAEHMGAKEVYLLTTTAEQFFAKQGFAKSVREEAPAAIRKTSEFTSLCPSTAVLMKKGLG